MTSSTSFFFNPDRFIDSEITVDPSSKPGTFLSDLFKEPTAVLVADVKYTFLI